MQKVSKVTTEHIRRSVLLLVALAVVLVLAALALPAAAHGLGPAFFCDAGTLSNCTDTADPALAEDAFGCEGMPGDVASCTNPGTGESSPYCVFMGEEGSRNRDAYLCGSAPDFSDQLVDRFWEHIEHAQQQGFFL